MLFNSSYGDLSWRIEIRHKVGFSERRIAEVVEKSFNWIKINRV